MKRIIILLISISIALSSLPQNSFAGCNLEPDEIDSLLEKYEQKLPYLEKEVELMVKMLNSKKHLAKIKQDLKMINKNNNSIRPQDTHFFRALKAFNLSPDQLTIKIKSNTYQLSDEITLQQRLLVGGCDIMYPTGLNDILPDITQNQMEKISELMNKTIDILTPFHLMAKGKISKISRDEYCKTNHDGFRWIKNVYCIFDFRRGRSYLFDFMARNPTAAKQFFIDNKIPNSYLEMLKKYFQFLAVTGAHPREKSWKFYTRLVDEVLAEKAENGDMFGDLDSDASPTDKAVKPASTGADSGELNFDDLKLPK